MTIDFEPDETETAVADALTSLCRDHWPESSARADPHDFPRAFWTALAEFGFFTLATPSGMGGVVEVHAAGAVLGGANAPGPLFGSVFAMQVLAGGEQAAVAAGQRIVALCAPPLIPWAGTADLLLETDGKSAWRLEPSGPVEPVETLGGEPWGRGPTERTHALGPASRACAVLDVFAAAYLAAGARKLLRETSAYVSTRRQFGKTLSQFQGVTHPLAEGSIRARAAATLGRVAAHQLEMGEPTAAMMAASARISAENAAMQSVYIAHQSYGAMGMTVDGPVYYQSRRLRQLVNQQQGVQARLQAIEAAYFDGQHAPLRAALA